MRGSGRIEPRLRRIRVDRVKGSYSRITAYVGKEFVFSCLVSFLFFFCIFFINQMLLLAEEILSKKVPFQDVALLIIYSLPSIIALSFPFATLVGGLMAVGKFSSANEIIAFQASGISLMRIFFPFVVLSVVFSCVSFVMNDYYLPLSTLKFGRLYRKMLYSHPELEMESYSIKNFQESIIATGRVEHDVINSLLIVDKEPDGNKRIISASRADIDKSIEGVVSLRLKNVVVHSIDRKEKDKYTYSFADSLTYNILLRNISLTFRNPGPREMSSYDVYKEIVSKRKELKKRESEHEQAIAGLGYRYGLEYASAVKRLFAGEIGYQNAQEALKRTLAELDAEKEREMTDRSLQLHLIEFYKKFSIPFGCMVFIFLAFPIGLFTKKSGRSMGFGIGLFVSIFYWGLMVAGQTLGIRSNFSPFLSMWIPDAVILAIGGAAFLVRRVR